MLNFRVPTIPDIVEDMGRSLDFGNSEHEDDENVSDTQAASSTVSDSTTMPNSSGHAGADSIFSAPSAGVRHLNHRDVVRTIITRQSFPPALSGIDTLTITQETNE